jgi:hypothetical protein
MILTDPHLQAINDYIMNQSDDRHFLHDLADDWVLYGTGTAQLMYLAVMDAVAEVFMGLQSFPVTRKQVMDRYGVHSGHKELTPSVSNYYVQFNAGTVQVDRTGVQQAPIQLSSKGFQTKASEDFFTRFNTSPLSLQDLTYEKLVGGIKKHDSKAPDRPKLREASTAKLIRYYAVRRACKYLIYDSIGNGVWIRYMLDDLDLRVVATKARVEEKVPVCTSELREVFRYWDYLSNYVTFYRDFCKVSPPWTAPTANPDTIQAWAAYADHRANKVLSDKNQHLPPPSLTLLKDCVSDYLSGNYVGAIDKYHQSRPSSRGIPVRLNDALAVV